MSRSEDRFDTGPPTVYCEALSPSVLIWLAKRIIRCGWRARPRRVLVLDETAGRRGNVLLAALPRMFGVRVAEVPFFTGDLRTRDGIAVYYAARTDVATRLAFAAARRIVERPVLRRIAHLWPEGTVFKAVAGSLQRPSIDLALRLLAADSLRRNSSAPSAIVLLRRRVGFEVRQLAELVPEMEVHLYGVLVAEWRRANRLLLLFALPLLWARERWRRATRAVEAVIDEPDACPDDLPTLLTLMEDDVSLDRSYRTQPHWLLPEAEPPAFRTLILKLGAVPRIEPDTEMLSRHRVQCLQEAALHRLPIRVRMPAELRRRLRRSKLLCVAAAFSCRTAEVNALVELLSLFRLAEKTARFCLARSVRAFLVCENYLVHADAVLLIAPALGIRTVSFQYTNRVAPLVPRMLTTADIMVTMSPLFHAMWERPEIRPGRFLDAGYLYDASFVRVAPRAVTHRRRFQSRGAEFVICYFDESVQYDKYGLVSPAHVVDELWPLLEWLRDDGSVALVLKPQFRWNSPRRHPALRGLLEAAESTGRYLELSHGVHRNIVFAAEAALTADIAIGHAFGGTATLEGALAGQRSLLLNPYGVRSAQDRILDRADIVYPSIEAAISAIQEFRAGLPARRSLGDWTPILGEFDPFRDGRAASRLRSIVEQSLGLAGRRDEAASS